MQAVRNEGFATEDETAQACELNVYSVTSTDVETNDKMEHTSSLSSSYISHFL